MLGDDTLSFNKVASEQSRVAVTFTDIFEVDGKFCLIAVSCLVFK